MTSDRPAPTPKAARDARAEREAKLAQALRANLRRRKAEAKPERAQDSDGDSA
jgi:hypothetical protein